MKFEAVTIKDIAKELGVSISTVSRALKDSHEISTETKKLVFACAEKLNYKPNPIALSLKEKRSRSIGVVVCEIASVFFSQIINGIESVAYDSGYNIIITQSLESYKREVNDLQYLASRSVDGIIISLSTETSDVSHIKKLQDRGMPVVLFDRINSAINTHTVTVDNYQGAYDATEHLINNGFKKIAAIVGAEYLSITRERLAGFKAALSAHKIRLNKDYVKYCFHSGVEYAEIQTAVSQLLAMKQKPDAIFCASDQITMDCLKTLHARKVVIPGEIALAGFSNTNMAELLNPPLTIVKQPGAAMGREAANLLIDMIESKKPLKNFEHRVFKPLLQTARSSEKRS